VPSLVPVFLGTIVLGIGIAVANVLLPSIIKRRYADPGLMMGLFTASLSVSGALSAALTVPLEESLGDWRWALAFWALPILPALALWAPDVRRWGTAPTAGTGPAVGLRHDRIAWLVTGAFGLQSLLFYAHLSWVPDIFRDAGLSSTEAGVMLSISMLVGIPASLGLPVLATRLRDQRLLGVLPPLMWAAGLAGLLVDPGGASWLWMVLTGIGQGSGIALTLTLVVLRASDGASAAALSGMAQGIGYIVAAAGPFLLGAIHDLTGGWEWPLATLLVVSAGMLACCIGAGRDRFVEGIPPNGGSSPARP
jgi:CP family cyanate transporter-like MFS transporter